MQRFTHILCLVAILALTLTLAPAAQAGPSNTMTVVKDLPGVRIHSVLLAPSWNAAHIFETEQSLIIMDTMGTIPDAQQLRAYAESLGKPIKRVLLSHAHDHHILGADVFKDLPIYALPGTIADIKTKGAELVAEAKAKPNGAGVPDAATVPQFEINPGQERIDGLLFNWMNVPIGMDILFIDLPEAGALVTHHLLYNGMHAFLAPDLDAWEGGLKKFQSMGRQWIMAAHGIPGGPEVFTNQLVYLKTVRNIVAAAPNLETAKSGIVASFPTFPCDFLLNASLPAFYSE